MSKWFTPNEAQARPPKPMAKVTMVIRTIGVSLRIIRYMKKA